MEPDKWPLVLARDCGRATSDHGVRRVRVSFDGQRQIAKKMILLNPVQLRISFDLHNTIQNTFGFSFDFRSIFVRFSFDFSHLNQITKLDKGVT